MRPRALVLAALAWCAQAYAEPLHTGALTMPSVDQPMTRLGGGETTLTLYLRTDGNEGEIRKHAIDTCLAGLARVPGAGVDIYVEPNDRGSAALADALADLDGEPDRRALLAGVAAQGVPHWADSGAFGRIIRGRGWKTRTPMVSRSNGVGGLSSSRLPQRFTFPSGSAGHAYLRRPAFMPVAGRSQCTLEGRAIDDGAIDRLARTDEPVRSAPALRVDGSVGSVLARRALTIRVDLQARSTLRDVVARARPLLETGRLRIRLEVVNDVGPSREAGALVRGAMRLVDGPARLRLAEAIIADLPVGPSATSVATEAWLLQAAQISPEEILAILDAEPQLTSTQSRTPGPADDAEKPAPEPLLSIDGVPASASEISRSSRMPSLRARLAARARVLVARPLVDEAPEAF